MRHTFSLFMQAMCVCVILFERIVVIVAVACREKWTKEKKPAIRYEPVTNDCAQNARIE